MTKRFRYNKAFGAGMLIVALLPLQKCSSLNNYFYNHNLLRVETDPPGADVYVMNKKVAVTPAAIRDIKVYPAGYDKKYEKSYGYIEIIKKGCDSVQYRVEPKDFRKGIYFKLRCEQIYL